jgi:hypothetical protein
VSGHTPWSKIRHKKDEPRPGETGLRVLPHEIDPLPERPVGGGDIPPPEKKGRRQRETCPHCGWTGLRPRSCLADVACSPEMRRGEKMEPPDGA